MDLDPRTNYAAKVAVSLGVVLIVGGLVGAYTITTTEAQVQRQQMETLGGQADVQADVVDAFVTDIDDDAVRVAEATADIRAEHDDSEVVNLAVGPMLRREAASAARLRAAHFVDASTGEILASSDGATAASTLGDLGYPPPASIDASLEEPALRFVSHEGEHRWAVFVAAGPDRLIVQNVDPGIVADSVDPFVEGTRTRIVADDGRVVLDVENDSAMGTQHVPGSGMDSPAVMAGVAGEENTTMIPASESGAGERVAASFARIGDGWALVSYGPPEKLFAVADSVTRNILLLLGAIGLVLVAFGLVVERKTVTTIDRLASRASRLSDGDLDAEITTTRRDQLGSVFHSLDEMRANLSDRIAEASAARESAETARQEAEDAREEAESAKQDLEDMIGTLEAEATGAMNRAADGDLTVRMDADGTNETIAEIQAAFNDMMVDIEATLTDVQAFADDVAAASETATDGLREIEAASEEVSESIAEISSGATDQREHLQVVSQEMNQLSATIEEVASSAQTVANRSQETAAIADTGEETASEAIEQARAVQRTMESTVTNVEQLDTQMDRIGEIVELIGDVAEQTNILALNASIEATHAGNGTGGDGANGEGFAVVADEVKNLAEETRESAGEIEALIGEVQAQTETTVGDVRTADERVAETVDAVGEGAEAFDTVAENAAETDGGVQEISDATDDQAKSAEEAVSMVDEVAEISRQTADEAERVSAAATQQATSISQISSNVESLSDRADQLRTLLSRFEVDSTGDR